MADVFSNYCDQQLNFFTHRRLLDALAPHTFDGTELHHQIDLAAPGLEHERIAASIKQHVIEKYRDTIPIGVVIEIVLKLVEDGALT